MSTIAEMLTTAAATRASTKASPRRKLTKDEADDIRRLHARGVSIADLSRQYDLNPEGIKGILDGRYYASPDRPQHTPIKRRVTWRYPEAGLPDSDIEVLVALDDGDVRPAFHDGEQWRDISAWPLADGAVLLWCEYPDHPKPPKGA